MLKLQKTSKICQKSLRHATFVELHLLYLLYLLLIVIVIAGEKKCSKTGHRLRPPASVVLDVHGGLCCQQQLGALHVAVECCPMQRSPTSAPAEWPSRRRDRRSLSSPAASAAQDVHGGALRHEERHDRRVAVPGCPVQRCQAVRIQSVQAAAVAAQVAPDGREVAVFRRAGDVGVSAPGGMKQK